MDLARWEIWLAPTVGLVFAGLSLAVGRRWLTRRSLGSVPPGSAASAEAAAEAFKNKDRRASSRRRGKGVRVRIESAAPSQEALSGWVQDRSNGGLGLLLTEEIAVDTVLSVRPTAAPEHLPWIQLVVANKRWDGDRWEIGCRFVQAPPWAILTLLD